MSNLPYLSRMPMTEKYFINKSTSVITGTWVKILVPTYTVLLPLLPGSVYSAFD
jgi:hypothetical protein